MISEGRDRRYRGRISGYDCRLHSLRGLRPGVWRMSESRRLARGSRASISSGHCCPPARVTAPANPAVMPSPSVPRWSSNIRIPLSDPPRISALHDFSAQVRPTNGSRRRPSVPARPPCSSSPNSLHPQKAITLDGWISGGRPRRHRQRLPWSRRGVSRVSARNNLRYALGTRARTRIWAAARDANAETFLRQLPSVSTRHGRRPPPVGRQRQRIARPLPCFARRAFAPLDDAPSRSTRKAKPPSMTRSASMEGRTTSSSRTAFATSAPPTASSSWTEAGSSRKGRTPCSLAQVASTRASPSSSSRAKRPDAKEREHLSALALNFLRAVISFRCSWVRPKASAPWPSWQIGLVRRWRLARPRLRHPLLASTNSFPFLDPSVAIVRLAAVEYSCFPAAGTCNLPCPRAICGSPSWTVHPTRAISEPGRKIPPARRRAGARWRPTWCCAKHGLPTQHLR